MSSATIPCTGAVAVLPPIRANSPRGRGLTARLGAGFFALLHVACLAAALTGVTVPALLLCAGVYFLHMFGITAGFHRYFSHRTFKTSRLFQFALAWLGCSAGQRGPLWWAARHRHHHRTSDTPDDLHSPVTHTLWQSHIGWVLSPESDGTDERAVKDLGRYPELRWLDRYHWLPPAALAALCLLAGGWAGLVWGFCVAGVLSHHATFTVNSLCHLWGRRRYATPDASRNNALVAVLTLGEGWHNNHHYRPGCAAQGVRWWEVDVTYYLIWLLAAVGVVWDVRRPRPGWARRPPRPAGGRAARPGGVRPGLRDAPGLSRGSGTPPLSRGCRGRPRAVAGCPVSGPRPSGIR